MNKMIQVLSGVLIISLFTFSSYSDDLLSEIPTVVPETSVGNFKTVKIAMRVVLKDVDGTLVPLVNETLTDLIVGVSFIYDKDKKTLSWL